MKANLLYRLAQFTEWPPEAVRSAEPFVIGVFGPDPFGPDIDSLEKFQIDGRPIRILRFRNLTDMDHCRLIYISPTESWRFHWILKKLHRKRVLTVSEGAGFTRQGGIVGFVEKDGGIGFIVNKKSADAAGVRLSSDVLSLAENVQRPS